MKELINLIIRKWWIFFICVAICGTGAYIWTNHVVVPLYSSNTTLYVGKDVGMSGIQTNDVSLINDLNLGSNLIGDYQELAKSRLVTGQVISELGLKNINPDSLAGMIQVAQLNQSRVILISVTFTNPVLAMEIANKVAEVLQKKINEIMQIDNVQIIDKAELQNYPISPNRKMNYQIGIIIGLLIGVLIIFLILFLDKTIKTEGDVQKHFDLPVIGNIPIYHTK